MKVKNEALRKVKQTIDNFYSKKTEIEITPEVKKAAENIVKLIEMFNAD